MKKGLRILFQTIFVASILFLGGYIVISGIYSLAEFIIGVMTSGLFWIGFILFVASLVGVAFTGEEPFI